MEINPCTKLHRGPGDCHIQVRLCGDNPCTEQYSGGCRIQVRMCGDQPLNRATRVAVINR